MPSFSAVGGERIAAVASARKNGSSADGVLSVIFTVIGSGVSIVSMLAKTRLRLLVLFAVVLRSKVNFTSAAVKSLPSWNFTPLRSLNVKTLLPSCVQLSASAGWILPCSSKRVRPSNRFIQVTSLTAVEACIVGSSPGGSVASATTTWSFAACAGMARNADPSIKTAPMSFARFIDLSLFSL